MYLDLGDHKNDDKPGGQCCRNEGEAMDYSSSQASEEATPLYMEVLRHYEDEESLESAVRSTVNNNNDANDRVGRYRVLQRLVSPCLRPRDDDETSASASTRRMTLISSFHPCKVKDTPRRVVNNR